MNGQRHVLFEMIRIGNSVKMTAIDGATGQEAVIIGPASAGERTLKANALRKLDYVLGKGAGPAGKPGK